VPQDQGLVREGGEGQRSEKFEREVRSSGVTAESLCRLMQDRRRKFPDSVDELQGGPRERTGSVRKGRLFPNHGDDFVGALRERDIQSVSDCRMQQESDRPRERNVQVREVQQGISELQVSPARLRKTVVTCDFVFLLFLSVQMNIGDWSDNQWVSLFSSEAEKILGKTSQEVGLAMENDTEAATAIFREANFKQFVFKCRAKLETYNVNRKIFIFFSLMNVLSGRETFQNRGGQSRSGQL
jgi:hypothetical protein